MTGATDAGARALLLVDFQHDFLNPSGRMPVARAHVMPMLDAVQAIIDDARRHHWTVIEIANAFRRRDLLGNHVRRRAAIAGSPGAAWDTRVSPRGATRVHKWRANAFTNPELERCLERAGVADLLITGVYAKACVKQTAKAALRSGYTVEIVEDAVACSSDRSRARALRDLERAGARIVGLGEIC